MSFNHPAHLRRLALMAVAFALAAIIIAYAQGQSSPAPSSGGYASTAACAQCHAAIAATYRKTGMGRSFYRLTPEKATEDFTSANTFHLKSSDSYFAMISRGGKYFQRRWQVGFDGKETEIDEKQIDYVLGSGNHARSYLHLTAANTLQLLPLGWYSEKGGYWAMNPGYDRPDYLGSVRPIYYECMFCHNGYPAIPQGGQRDASEQTYVQPLPEGIDCQRCHGPGQMHVDRATAHAPAAGIRAAIVNPARLNADRGIEVCMQCHLETNVRKLPHDIRRFNRGPFSYVPGQPLGDFSIAFDRKPGTNTSFEIAQGAYRLRESQCFLKSQGKLQCTTCHNPHDIPRGAEAAVHYNEICRNCHTAELQRMASSAAHSAAADCVSCHMPRRRTDDAVHTVMTDHLITRNVPRQDLTAEKPEVVETAADAYRGEVLLYYPPQLPPTPDNTLYKAVAQVRDQSNLTQGLPQLRKAIEEFHPAEPGFYAELAQGYRASGNNTDAIHYFEEALRQDPNSASRFLQLGDALMDARQFDKAETQFRKTTELAPGDARGWGRLGWALWQQDKGREARATLEKALDLDNEIPEVHNNLGLLLWGTGDRAGAAREFRAALRIQPGIAEWRLNLGRALAAEGQTPEARFQIEQSLKLKPEYVEARFVYAQLLADLNEIRDAQLQAKIVIDTDPNSPPAHELLGSLLAQAGDINGAERELLAAVRLQPAFGRAQFELGMVLVQKGDAAAAVEHLKIAAQSKDPQASAAARQALQQVGR